MNPDYRKIAIRAYDLIQQQNKLLNLCMSTMGQMAGWLATEVVPSHEELVEYRERFSVMQQQLNNIAEDHTKLSEDILPLLQEIRLDS